MIHIGVNSTGQLPVAIRNILMAIFFFMAVLFSLALFFSLSRAANASSWEHSLSGDYLNSTFDGTTNKEAVSNISLQLDTSYLDSFNVGVIYRNTLITTELDTFKQQEFGLNAHKHFYSDMLNGRITLGGNRQVITGNAVDPTLGETTTSAAGVKYINFSKSFYTDLQFSNSVHDAGVDVLQNNFTIGFRLFSPRYWLQARLYKIEVEDLTEKIDYQSIDWLFRYWIESEALLFLDSVYIGAISGNRRLAYDPDSYTTWNLDNEQTSYVRIGFGWDLRNNSDISLVLGSSDHRTVDQLEEYTSRFAYLSFKKTW
ncbi:MAG: hypothetical protein COC04_06335 [Gammaproteobacteria bacterium]|nr:MAG: hypothetical protein COC04_06335 [Gammaproteobacteria bacterium]